MNASGKRSIVFTPNQGYRDLPVEVPCGQCIGCRLERSRQWAIRCVHEASLHSRNSFITLTYNNENLPKDGSLQVKDFQKFMKRLRRALDYETSSQQFIFDPSKKLRFFHCGEYGENFGRPHYHACLFNLDFRDRKYWKTVNGSKYYVSQTLSELWPFGYSMVGDVTFESAAYVARYITKKVTGKNALHHYNEIDINTGEVLVERRPEYVTMSRRPGIGRGWFDKYTKDVFPDDFVVIRGRKMKPPKYYLSQFEITYPTDHALIKARRKKKGKESKDNTVDRLMVREEIQKERAKLLKRNYENET